MPRISCGSVESGKVLGYDTACLRTAIALILLASVAWAQVELQRALTLTRAGRFREARDVIASVPVPAPIPQQIAYHRLKAAIASGLQDNNTAAQEMEAALALSPEDQLLRLATAVSEEQAGRPDQAIALLSRAQGSADAKGLLGQVLERRGRHVESISAYREAVRLDPGREAFRLALGRELIALGAFEQAKLGLDDSLTKFPRSAPLLTLLGILEYSGGQTDAARQILPRAIAADPAYKPAYRVLARIVLDSSGTPGREEVVSLCRWDKITCSALQVRLARDRNEKELEARSIAELRDAPSGNATAACALGQAYAWSDQPQQARVKMETCVKLDPTPQNHYRLAQIYRKLGQTALAQAQLEARNKLLKVLSDQTAKAADSLAALESQIK